MKIDLVYPKIPSPINCPLKRFYAYEKLDGTNTAFYWNKTNHWYAFGTRRDRFPLTTAGIKEFNQAHPGLEEVVPSFLDCGKHTSVAVSLDNLFISKSYSELIIFTEFLGEKSFAGQHQKDDHKDHYLIDIMIDGKIISPEQLECLFQVRRSFMPRLIYKGKFTGAFVEKVRQGHYKVGEGVVCKGIVNGKVYMCKIKTDAYLKRLKEEFKDEWKNYWE